MKEKWIEFLIELKKLVRDSGRTNFILKGDIDKMFVEYEVNLSELEKSLASGE